MKTREQMIDDIVYAWMADSHDIARDMILDGFKGLRNMTDEEVKEEYKTTFEGEEE